ncbi:hypothetical protein MesoLjLc_16550 [Mesorhizobium sp. L-8-10]|uniref:hypothetical protein n=1 Tax=Mesorhizobium sp. L-8-10 TaxID=2744523 RepID=UPI001928A566|nr:hypothetical protein [Mesorhizobium sp. L-8-10]BCH29725.1 hypothetical protein MesoLjLc_16550 [Mesorhizobium sp. L-8-10]
MEATGKPESKFSERRLFQSLLSWLFAAFAAAATPIVASPAEESGGVRTLREIGPSEGPLRHIADASALVAPAETERAWKNDPRGDCDDAAPVVLPAPPAVASRVLVTLSFRAADQTSQNTATGFSSRAPPALA